MATVIYPVPLIPQCGQNTCWYAAAQMIVAYRRGLRGQQSPWTVIGTDRLTGIVCQGDQRLDLGNPQSVRDFARHASFRAINQWPQSAASLAHLLTAHGPLWYCGAAQGYRGLSGDHVLVIAGIDNDVLNLNDPWEPNVGWQGQYGVANFLRNLPQVASTPLLAYGP